eukprot:m.190171 g.190171  ORF g.190171 m.190171 type:complete len:208 (-) comp17559_c0_seq1:139-762(-)
MVQALLDHLCVCVWPIVASFFVVLVLGIFIYFGAFQKIYFYRVREGGFHLVYREFEGEYRNVTPKFAEVTDALRSCGLLKSMFGRAGMYFDDPGKTAKGKCRAYCGFMMKEDDLTADVKKTLASNDLLVQHIPPTDCMVTDFPFRGWMSIIVAVMRVYPAAKRELGSTWKGAPMELYNSNDMCSDLTTMRFAFPTEATPAFVHRKDQ